MSVAFHPQNAFIASSSDGGTVRVWDTRTLECVYHLFLRKPYEHMNITSARGLTETERANLKRLGAIETEEKYLGWGKRGIA
jgi:WD40 repeat protein